MLYFKHKHENKFQTLFLHGKKPVPLNNCWKCPFFGNGITELLGLEGISVEHSMPLLRQGYLEQVTQEHVQVGFQCFQGARGPRAACSSALATLCGGRAAPARAARAAARDGGGQARSEPLQ